MNQSTNEFLTTTSVNSATKISHKRLIVRLCLVLLFMVGFTIALVPLYDVLCNAFGINGKTGDITYQQSLNYQTDNNRQIDLSFMGKLNGVT